MLNVVVVECMDVGRTTQVGSPDAVSLGNNTTRNLYQSALPVSQWEHLTVVLFTFTTLRFQLFGCWGSQKLDATPKFLSRSLR